MNDDLPPLEPDPEPTSSPPPPPLSPLRTESDRGTKFIEAAGRGCLGTVSFSVAVMIFGTIVIANQILGLALSILVIAGMFALRKRSGPSTMLGAVAVGASIALILAGACAIIMLNLGATAR
jgi:hypothetical protein